MSDLDIQIPNAFDPFAEATAEDSSAGSKKYVHIRIQQRNGRKSLTTMQGLKKEFSYNKILKDLKEFCCNGTVVEDPELGQHAIFQCPTEDHVFITAKGYSDIVTRKTTSKTCLTLPGIKFSCYVYERQGTKL